MPRSACSNLPTCFSVAPVNDPFSWPNSSDSISSSGIAAQLTCTNRSRLRRLLRWIVRATSSLPTPLSPVISTVALVGAARPTAAMICFSPLLSPIIWCRTSTAFFSVRTSSRSCRESSAFCRLTSTRSLANGFSMKSKAPFLVASTAVLIVPCPDTTTTGSASFMLRSRSSTSMPSMPGILTSSSTRSGASRSASASPSWPVAAPMNS